LDRRAWLFAERRTLARGVVFQYGDLHFGQVIGSTFWYFGIH